MKLPIQFYIIENVPEAGLIYRAILIKVTMPNLGL